MSKEIDELKKAFAKNKDIKMGAQSWGALSTGSLTLDVITGVGGWLCGKVNVVAGKESSGKSTICMKTIAAAQAQGKVVGYVDTEASFDTNRAGILGVDMDNLLLVNVKTLEQGGETLLQMIDSQAVDLVIFDSVGGSSVKALEEGEIGDALIGRRAKIMSHLMMRLVGPLGFYGSTAIFVNQWRDSIANPYEVILPGGWAFSHATQLRVLLSSKKPKDSNNDGTLIITAKIHKNKAAVPFKSAEFTLYPNGTVDKAEEIAGIITNSKLITDDGEFFVDAMGITRTGAWYALPEDICGAELGAKKFQGSDAIAQALRDDPKLMVAVETELFKRLTRRKLND